MKLESTNFTNLDWSEDGASASSMRAAAEVAWQGERVVGTKMAEAADEGEPLAFVIIASAEQSIESLRRLLRALDGPEHS